MQLSVVNCDLILKMDNPSKSRKVRINKSYVHEEFEEISWTCPKTNKEKFGQVCKVSDCGVQIAGIRSTNMKAHLASKHIDVYNRVLGNILTKIFPVFG